MKSGGYYGKTKPLISTEKNELPDYSNYYSNDDDDDDDDHVFRQPRVRNYNKDYAQNNHDINRQENAMNMKFDIIHKEPINDYSNNNIYRLKPNDLSQTNGRSYYVDYNNNRNDSSKTNKRSYDIDYNNNNNYDERSDKIISDLKPAIRKPCYEFIVALLTSYPLTKEEANNSELSEEALNKYIKIGQIQMKDRREIEKPKKTDVAYNMYLYPECIALVDLQSKTLVRRHAIDKIMIYGYSKKKKDPIFAYIHQEKEQATCWIFHTFKNASFVSEAFKKICIEKSNTTNFKISSKAEYNRNPMFNINSKNNSNGYSDNEFASRKSITNDVRYASDQEMYANESRSKKSGYYYYEPAEGARSSRQALRSFDEDTRPAPRSASHGPHYATHHDVQPPRYQPQYKPSFNEKEPDYVEYNGRLRYSPIDEEQSYLTARKAAPAGSYISKGINGGNHHYNDQNNMRFVSIYEEQPYLTTRKALPAISAVPASSYNSRGYNGGATKTRVGTGTINQRYNDGIVIKSSVNEIIKTIRCRCVGFLTVNKVGSVESMNKIAHHIISSLPQSTWLNVKVEISSTKIKILGIDIEPIFQSNIANMNYINHFSTDKRFAVVSTAESDGRSMCHVFYCEPNGKYLLRSLNSAYQDLKEKSIYARKNGSYL